jgi:glycosyltransferase involved in cell wall biosynthesis
MGIPVISTRIGAEGVYDEHNPLIPLSDFPADFAKKLIELLDDTDKALQLGQDVRTDILERFGFERAVDMIKDAWPV